LFLDGAVVAELVFLTKNVAHAHDGGASSTGDVCAGLSLLSVLVVK
jgi:hypothetical protein